MPKRYFKHPAPYLIALLLGLLFYAIPPISKLIIQHPTFSNAAKDASFISGQLQRGLLYPLGKWLSLSNLQFIALPWFIVLLLLLRIFYLHTRKFWKYALIVGSVGLLFLYLFPNILLVFDNNQASQSHGHVAKGRIVNSKRIPYRGANYTTYSFLGYLGGRTFVHDKVRELVLTTYDACLESHPDRQFILGETGHRSGGRFLPHRTHQNGLSVDFMSPLLKNGQPYQPFSHCFNLWSYGWEFDKKGQSGKVSIDFEGMAGHLYQLKRHCASEGLVIQKVIFDPVLRPLLLATPSGQKIKDLPFTKNRVYVRHDDHYHIDFGIKAQ
ncbi:MAG: hypothetical protein AAGG75_08340 [Bacteroidota bacterium]